jgi:hypothetical protein
LRKAIGNPAFVIPSSRLHNIESKNKIPSIHRLYALAPIYRRTMNEFLLYTDFHCDAISAKRNLFGFQNKFECAENHGRFAAIPSLL